MTGAYAWVDGCRRGIPVGLTAYVEWLAENTEEAAPGDPEPPLRLVLNWVGFPTQLPSNLADGNDQRGNSV